MSGIIWVCGFIVGLFVPVILRKALSSGTVEIDLTDPEIPYLRLQITNEQLDRVCKKKYVLFNVKSDADFTRKKQSL